MKAFVDDRLLEEPVQNVEPEAQVQTRAWITSRQLLHTTVLLAEDAP